MTPARQAQIAFRRLLKAEKEYRAARRHWRQLRDGAYPVEMRRGRALKCAQARSGVQALRDAVKRAQAAASGSQAGL